MSGTKVHLSDEDAKKLRQEILEQEALIRGYQVINREPKLDLPMKTIMAIYAYIK